MAARAAQQKLVCEAPTSIAIGRPPVDLPPPLYEMPAPPKKETHADRIRKVQHDAVNKIAKDKVARLVAKCQEAAERGMSGYTFTEKDVGQLCVIADTLAEPEYGFKIEVDPDAGQIHISW